MSTLNISLPEPMRAFVEVRVTQSVILRARAPEDLAQALDQLFGRGATPETLT